MSTHPRFVLLGTTTIALLVGLAIGGGAVLASGPTTAPATPAAAPSVSIGAPPVPSTTDTTTLNGATTGAETVAAGGGTVAGSAIAYPYYGGTPGLGPDHTILVTGIGQANVKSDGSNRAAAEKKALTGALADARSQADAIASATGLSVTGVLSVSASVSPYGVAMPMMTVPGGAPNAPVPAPTDSAASPELLSVSVAVAYTVS